jgi:hypothetical protein
MALRTTACHVTMGIYECRKAKINFLFQVYDYQVLSIYRNAYVYIRQIIKTMVSLHLHSLPRPLSP